MLQPVDVLRPTTMGDWRIRSRAMRVVSGILLRLALLAFSLAIVFGSLELGLRLFWDGFYLKPQEPYTELDPVRGWRNRSEVSVVFAAPEFGTVVSNNAWGYRSAPVELARSPGRPRVVLLGDSFTYGHGVEDDETFGAQLGVLLPELEVINTGVDGYGTAQQLLLLRDEGLCFQPDVVVVAFFWNDLADNRKEAGAALGQPPGVVAWFSMEDGELIYPPETSSVPLPPAREAASSDREGRRSWQRHMYAYRFLSDRIKIFRFWLDSLRGVPVDGDTLLADEAAWQLELALLGEIDRLSREAGARMLLLVIPDQVQVQPDTRAATVAPDAYAVQERLQAFAGELGIPILDPLPALRAAYEAEGEALYYLNDRHLRANGQAIVAGELAARLVELGWLGTPDGGASHAEEPSAQRSAACTRLVRRREASRRPSEPGD
jgi:lysophospholipase L1-like esterase